jgi:hypothetical protein
MTFMDKDPFDVTVGLVFRHFSSDSNRFPGQRVILTRERLGFSEQLHYALIGAHTLSGLT